MILSSYSLTIYLTVLQGVGTGFLILNAGFSRNVSNTLLGVGFFYLIF